MNAVSALLDWICLSAAQDMRDANQFPYRPGHVVRTQLQYGEETITERFLLDLSRHFPRDNTLTMQLVSIAHVKNSKAQYPEPTTGSDWEWHFGGTGGQWFSMRVQAKKAKRTGKQWGYAAIGWPRSGKTTFQIDDLIRDAGNRYWPAYAFYDSRFRDKTPPLGVCAQCPRLHPYFGGMTYADAHVIQGLRQAKTLDRDTVLTVSAPMPCLFDCVGRAQANMNLPQRVRAFAAGVSQRSAREGTAGREPPPVLTDPPPQYVLNIVNRAEETPDAPVVLEGLSEEDPISRLRGIVIIRERVEIPLNNPK
ncbi:hypothetical protein SAMN02745126_04434 [Enhydrobacter aerosaccus]|uniref:Uncharacterized protein n=1 Tax=Enhydrobacter aerosaccus TaxID=225324 RepID=A0A1T4SA32_9HYPH|nr:DUF6615 family protein [Enhydrobacter aerosaccus]SKA24721.1 hypothetical protein SAMN02745126_04434 [Enhydrobacter aerosaccus]